MKAKMVDDVLMCPVCGTPMALIEVGKRGVPGDPDESTFKAADPAAFAEMVRKPFEGKRKKNTDPITRADMARIFEIPESTIPITKTMIDDDVLSTEVLPFIEKRLTEMLAKKRRPGKGGRK